MIHFISGLPRSGSTLLASLLAQNPDFHASVESPVAGVLTAVTGEFTRNEASVFLDEHTRARVLRGLFHSYYAATSGKVVFDNHRSWTANASLIRRLYPQSKIICCLRHPVAIINSFERMHHRNALHLSAVIGRTPGTNIYARMKHYMDPLSAFMYGYNSVKDALYANRDMLITVNYERLAQRPAQTMEEIHVALGLPLFQYDFEHVRHLPLTREFDTKLDAPGLHDVRSRVHFDLYPVTMPPDIVASIPKPFWLPVKKEATNAV